MKSSPNPKMIQQVSLSNRFAERMLHAEPRSRLPDFPACRDADDFGSEEEDNDFGEEEEEEGGSDYEEERGKKAKKAKVEKTSKRGPKRKRAAGTGLPLHPA